MAPTPNIQVAINKTQLEINESMELSFTGTADQVVVYTGDESHDYELRSQSNTGFVVNKGRFSYSYSTPGTYKVVYIASTYTERATDLKQDTCSFYVQVIDDHTEIQRLSCPQVIYDEVFAEAIDDTNWLMRLPRKIKFSTSTPSVSLSQRLDFDLASDSTKVYLNGVEWVSTKKYDLSSPIDIKVVSDFGSTRDYKLYTMQYPEFETFSIAGVEGTIGRNEFDYSDYTMTVTLPAGTDVSNIAPVFTTYSENEKVYLNNQEQHSGSSAANFTDGVTYTLRSTIEGMPSMVTESTFKVNIVFE